MNLRQLRSIATILQQGSFAAAGDRIGLSQSAISVQMQQLESSLGAELFDRSSRPVTLTPEGVRIANIAGDVLARLEIIKQVASGSEALESIAIGFIPTTVQNLLPRVLESLREAFPTLQVRVKSGLSGELATAVARRELDYALLTTPVVEIPDLDITTIAREPFYVIAPANRADIKTDGELLRSMPYIAFSRHTWVGQHIAAKLQQRGIHIRESIEIDSLEAIENLVAKGFGVSIVPRRLHARINTENIVQMPFGTPVDTRELALVRHVSRPRTSFDLALKKIFSELPDKP
ncbi:MAG: LysR family transcriptional regulator [Gammaproteobacteria bacterium]|nr:LysR family transcriptional regulator [Gammaproteobacteria bacterium]